jgi:flavin-dependent dehydrogenase
MAIKCEVLVVGAGPAGLSAALLLSKKGFSTIVLEKNEKVGSNITEYDITEGNRICKILNELDIKPKKKSSISEWISPNYNYILRSKIEDFYFKRGSEKDTIENLLFEKINNNLISVFFKSKVDSIKIKDKEVVEVEVDKYIEKIKIKPKYVIVADGTDSDLRRKMKVETNKLAKFNGFGVIIESDKKDVIPHSKIYFNQKIAPGGYIYSGSVGKETFFCIVSDDLYDNKKSLKQHLNRILKNEIKGEFSIKNYFSGTEISGIQEAIIGNVFFIGSAALFHDPFLGYGLNYAIESSYYAAAAIENNDLEIYLKYVNKIQKKFKESFFAREIWRQADNNFFDETIKAFNEGFITYNEEINKILKFFDESQIEI